MASTRPPVNELQFLKLTVNHLDFERRLTELNIPSPAFGEYTEYIGASWFHLGDDHLNEARSLLRLKNIPVRAVFSRSYYAAYNASKGVRYLTAGYVSLKGDDHGKATDLPGDFPEKEKWAKLISTLYENRLRADYDNWATTSAEFSEKPTDAVKAAGDFIAAARTYINNKLGSTI